MNTKTPQNPEPEGAPEEADTPPARLIQSESTTDIPVHLLFRDDSDIGAPTVPLRWWGGGSVPANSRGYVRPLRRAVSRPTWTPNSSSGPHG